MPWETTKPLQQSSQLTPPPPTCRRLAREEPSIFNLTQPRLDANYLAGVGSIRRVPRAPITEKNSRAIWKQSEKYTSLDPNGLATKF